MGIIPCTHQSEQLALYSAECGHFLPAQLVYRRRQLTLQNTICGRNPITVLLSLLQYEYAGKPEADNVRFNFVRYEQSSQCTSGRDSSVSYVSGVLTP